MLKSITIIRQQKYILIFMRLALGMAFLSAVADRFGLWGNPGEANVGWGEFQAFENYVLYLNPCLFDSLLTFVSWGVTVLEIILGILLIIGIKVKEVAFISATLLFIFGFAMTIVMGIKAPLDYSVFTASASAFLLYLYTTTSKVD